MGEITGELSRKRQYVISSGALAGISDVDIVTDDELLNACLEANATNRLKEIVGTIQGEQNQIIRSDLWKTLIVQGSAGAGKTTVALHLSLIHIWFSTIFFLMPFDFNDGFSN